MLVEPPVDQLQNLKRVHHLDSIKFHIFERFKYATAAMPAKTTPAIKIPERKGTNPILWVAVVVVPNGDVV